MDSVIAILTILGATAALVVVAVGSYVFIKGAYGQARLQALQQDLTNVRGSRDDLDRENKILKAKVEALNMRVGQLEVEGATAREMALQHANVDAAIEEIKKHGKESHDMWEKIMEKLDEALEAKTDE